jgi:membrane fusion protein (multidrug efflux system)
MLLTGCQKGDATTTASAWVPDKRPSFSVEALEVTRGKLVDRVEASGIVSGINEAYVVSETEGLIRWVGFELGQFVKAGQVLLSVDDQIARLNMEQAKQQYETAKLELAAAERLHASGNVSRAQLIKTQGDTNGAKAAYERALKVYNDCFLKAPIAGYIAEKDPGVALGNFLAPAFRVARIVDISSLELEVAIGEGEIGLIKPGAEASITVPTSPQPEHRGVVKAVAAGSDPLTGSYAVVVTWANTEEESVKAGMTAQVSIETTDVGETVIIPASALVRREGKVYVFLVENGKAKPQEVRPGKRLGSRIEIKEGVEEGDVLITSRLTALLPQDEVEVTMLGESGTWQ